MQPKPGDVVGNLSLTERAATAVKHGTSSHVLSLLIRRIGLYIDCGFPENHPVGGVSDSVKLIGSLGLLLTYRKSQLV